MLAVAMLASILITVTLAQGLAFEALARSRAAAAADAGALAAADSASGRVSDVPCEAAARVVAAHGARVTDCRLDGLVATVAASVPGPLGDVSVGAVAGPP